MSESEDILLLVRLKNGSLEAYEALFKKYYRLLCLEAYQLLNDKADAEDTVQHLFIEMWERKHFSEIRQTLKGYLCRAVRNRCLNRLQQRSRLKEKQQKYMGKQEEEPVTDWAEQKEIATHLNTVLNELPAQRLQVFTLVYLEDKKYQEAAEELGISINSVKTHLKIALKTLRQRLSFFR